MTKNKTDVLLCKKIKKQMAAVEAET